MDLASIVLIVCLVSIIINPGQAPEEKKEVKEPTPIVKEEKKDEPLSN